MGLITMLKIVGLIMLIEGIIIASVVLGGLFTKWSDMYNKGDKNEYSNNDF